MLSRLYRSMVVLLVVCCCVPYTWAADPFSAPAQFDFGKGNSSVSVDVDAEGPFGINIPVSLSPNPVPLTGVLKINTINASTGAFQGELQNLKGEAEVTVVGLYTVDASATLNGSVTGVFQWAQDRVTIISDNVSAEVKIDGETQNVPSIQFVLNGTYSNRQLSITHEGSFSQEYQGQEFKLTLNLSLVAALEELGNGNDEGASTDFSGCWSGTWHSTTWDETGNVTAQLCQSGNTVTGEMFLTNTDAGDVRVPVTGTVNGNTLSISMEYDYEGHHATTDYTQGTLNGNTLSGSYNEQVDGSPYDQGTFTLTRMVDASKDTDGVWKGGGGSWFVQKYEHGGALVIFSEDLSSFTVYGVDSASGTDWTSNPDMGQNRYRLRLVFNSATQATATVTDLTTQTSQTYTLTKFAGIPPSDAFTETDGVWKGEPGSVFVQRYDHCGALIIMTSDMKTYQVYGVDSAIGTKWVSNPEMNTGTTSVDAEFTSATQCTVTIHHLAASTTDTYPFTLFAGVQ